MVPVENTLFSQHLRWFCFMLALLELDAVKSCSVTTDMIALVSGCFQSVISFAASFFVSALRLMAKMRCGCTKALLCYWD